MLSTKINYVEKLLRNFTIKSFKALNPKWVPHFMGINKEQFVTGKSRELNRLSRSVQVADKKLYKITCID